MGGKNARNNLSKNPRIVRSKNVGKKIVGKKGEQTFFIFKRITWPIKGGKTRETNFQKHTNRAIKNVPKKIVGKKGEKTYFIFTRISLQKLRGKKRAKQFFQKHTNSASKKCRKKIVWKKCNKRFLYLHEYRDPKGGGNARNKISRNTRIVRAKNVGKKSS